MLPFRRAITAATFVVLLTVVGGPVATLAGGPAQTSRAVGHLLPHPDIWGYAVARKPFTASYTPGPNSRNNSAGTVNTVNRYGVGNYVVWLPSLNFGALNFGTALVTPLSPNGNHICMIAGWGWHAPGPAEIDVKCFNRSGAPRDTAFSASIIDSQRLTGASAYVWANDPTSLSYTPDTTYQFNSTGATNTIHRVSLGRYAVRLPGLATVKGNVQVANGFAEVGNKPVICHVLSWGPATADLIVNIQCRTVAGAPADAQFTMLFARHQGLEGPGVGPIAYLDANRPSTTSYTPSPGRSFSSSGSAAHIARTAIGSYLVTLPGMPAGGAVQVTPYDSGMSHCVVSSIRTAGTPQKIGVSCYSPVGHPVDSRFGLTYQH